MRAGTTAPNIDRRNGEAYSAKAGKRIAVIFSCRAGDERLAPPSRASQSPVATQFECRYSRSGMKFARIADGTQPHRVFFQFTLVVLALLGGVTPIRAQNAPKTHTIHVTFDYDFKRFHGCAEKNKKPCLKQFNVYNVTDAGRRFLLFTIPAPPGAKGEVKNITGASKPLVFAPGQHMIAVTANTDQGGESDPRACYTMITIASDVPAKPPQPKK